MIDAIETITEAIPCNIVYGRIQAAEGIARALTAAGFVILPKSEVDAIREKALEEAATLISEGYKRPRAAVFNESGEPSKHDKCHHDKYMYEDCEQCAAQAIRSLKSGGSDSISYVVESQRLDLLAFRKNMPK